MQTAKTLMKQLMRLFTGPGNQYANYRGFPFIQICKSTHEDALTFTRSADTSSDDHVRPADFTEDLFDLVAAFCKAHPKFADDMWTSGGAETPSILDKFVNKAHFCVSEAPELVAPLARMLTGLASGISTQSRELTLARILEPNAPTGLSHHVPVGVFRLEQFLEEVEEDAMNLGAQPIQVGYRSGRAVEGTVLDAEYNYMEAVGRRLSDAQVSRLSATIDMMAALAPARRFILVCQEHQLRPVERLFCLLSTPVPGSLKASILHCLASIATSSTDTRMLIWQTMEEYRLLEVVKVPVEDVVSYGPRQSLKIDLENERRDGYYPVTDGFLALLSSLFCHDWDLLDDLHVGVRLPGVVPYVEFVVRCILLEYEDFHGNPDNDAHVWRLVSRSLEILGNVLRYYQLSELNPDSSWLRFHAESINNGRSSAGAIATGFAAANAATLGNGMYGTDTQTVVSYHGRTTQFGAHPSKQTPEQRYAADFGIEEFGYDMPGEVLACMRPRTAGYTIMAFMLGQDTPLLDLVLRLLNDEGHTAHMNDACTTHIDWICDLATALLNSPKLLYSKRNLPQQAQANANNFAYPVIGPGYEYVTCDRAYWRQRAVTAATALLYETSLRADRFTNVAHQVPRLYYLHYDMESNELPILPTKRILVIREFTDLVATCQALDKSPTTNVPKSPLTTFGAFLGTSTPDYASLPSLSMMSMRLLEFFSERMPTEDLLSAMTEDTAAATCFVATARQCLLFPESHYDQVELFTDSLLYRTLGGDICGGIYTPLPPRGPDPPLSLPAHVLPAYLYNYVLECEEDETYTLSRHMNAFEATQVATYTSGNTLRQTVLNFILSSFSPHRASLSHYLCGMHENHTSVYTQLTLPNDWLGYEKTCLGAIMKELGRNGLCWKHPAMGKTALELLYYLAASPVTAVDEKAAVTGTRSGYGVLEMLRRFPMSECRPEGMPLNDYIPEPWDSDTQTGIMDRGFLVELLSSCTFQYRRLAEQQDARISAHKVQNHETQVGARMLADTHACCAWLLRLVALEMNLQRATHRATSTAALFERSSMHILLTKPWPFGRPLLRGSGRTSSPSLMVVLLDTFHVPPSPALALPSLSAVDHDLRAQVTYLGNKVFQHAVGPASQQMSLCSSRIRGNGTATMGFKGSMMAGPSGANPTSVPLVDVAVLHRELYRVLDGPVGAELSSVLTNASHGGHSMGGGGSSSGGGYMSGSGGEPGADLHQAFVNDCLQHAALENAAVLALGYASDCAQAWRQVASLGAIVVASRDGGTRARGTSAPARSSGADALSNTADTASSVNVSQPNIALHTLTESVLLPLASFMHRPLGAPGAVHTYASGGDDRIPNAVAEHLSSCLLVLCGTLPGARGLPALTPDSYQSLLDMCCDMVKQAATTHGMGLPNYTVEVRGRLATVVSVLLRFPLQADGQASSPLSSLIGCDAIVSQSVLDEFCKRRGCVIRERAHDMIYVLCDDAVLAPLEWRLVALQCMTHIVRQLKCELERSYFSEVVQGLKTRGLITRLAEAFGPRVPFGTSTASSTTPPLQRMGATAIGLSGDGGGDILSATMDLFTVLASRPEGAAAIASDDILSCIVSADYTLTSASSHEKEDYEGASLPNAHNDILPSCTPALLSATRCLLVLNDTLGTPSIADATAGFLVGHRLQLASLMSLLDLDRRSAPTLTALRHAGDIVTLVQYVAQSACEQLRAHAPSLPGAIRHVTGLDRLQRDSSSVESFPRATLRLLRTLSGLFPGWYAKERISPTLHCPLAPLLPVGLPAGSMAHIDDSPSKRYAVQAGQPGRSSEVTQWFDELSSHPGGRRGGPGTFDGRCAAFFGGSDVGVTASGEQYLQKVVLLPRAAALREGSVFQLENHAELLQQIPRGIHDRYGLVEWTAFDQTKLSVVCKLARQTSISLRSLAVQYRTMAERELQNLLSGDISSRSNSPSNSRGRMGDVAGLIIIDVATGRRAADTAGLHNLVARARRLPDFHCVESARAVGRDAKDISAAFQRCLDQGATRIVCHPIHLRGDVSDSILDELIEAAGRRFPGLDYGVDRQLGLHNSDNGRPDVNVRDTHGAHCLTAPPNFSTLLFSFCTSANLALDLRAQARPLSAQNGAKLNADAPDVPGLCATMCDTANNLMAALHDSTYLMPSDAADVWREDVDSATLVVSQFEQSSFLGTVCGRLRELMGLKSLFQENELDDGSIPAIASTH